MNSNKRKMNWRALLSYVIFVFFCFTASASFDELNSMFLGLFAIAIIIIICTGFNERKKTKSRKNFESSMADFNITNCVKIGNDSAVYYDATKEKIRLVSIETNSYESKEIDNVIMKSATVCPLIEYPNSDKFFVIVNQKNQSTLLAKAYSGKISISQIEEFEPSIDVRGELFSFFGVDKINEKILFVQDINDYRVASYEDIIKVELIEDGKSISSKSSMRTIGGAALGGFIAGSAGMVVGGLSGKTTTSKEVDEIRVKILLRDIDKPEISILINSETINVEKQSLTYKSRIAEAQKIVDIVSVIIDQVDKRSKSANLNHQNENHQLTSIADELQKLANLKEKGILSEEEFNNLKSRLLDI